MKWPLHTQPLSHDETPVWNFYYLNACSTPADPTIVWGSEIRMHNLKNYLKALNTQSPVFVTPAHILLRAVACALSQHPQLNRRILKRRIYRFKDINLLMPFQKQQPPETDVAILQQVDHRSVVDIAQEMWQHTRDAAQGEFFYDKNPSIVQRLALPDFAIKWLFRLHLFLTNKVNLPARPSSLRHRTPSTIVNYLGFKGAPPMRSFKPSRFPNDGCTTNVTMGPTEEKPVAVDGEVVVRSVAPLIVRADHRLIDAYELARFLETIRRLLHNPEQIDPLPAPASTEPAETFSQAPQEKKENAPQTLSTDGKPVEHRSK